MNFLNLQQLREIVLVTQQHINISLLIFTPSLVPHVSEHLGAHVFLFVQAVFIASAT